LTMFARQRRGEHITPEQFQGGGKVEKKPRKDPAPRKEPTWTQSAGGILIPE